MRAATGAGTASSTSAKAPAASAAWASCRSWSAAWAVLPCARRPPCEVAVCGVRPRCATTGIPAPASARMRASMGPAPSSLTASARGLLEEPPGRAQGVLVAHLVRHERQVGDDQRAAAGARDGRRQHQHLVHRGGHGGGVAEHDHRGRVADEHEIDAGALGDAARRVVVGRDHHERPAVALGLHELVQRGLAGGRRPSRTTGWSCVLQGEVVDQARRAEARGDEQDRGAAGS